MPAATATIGPSGGFYNNGWGNGYQLPPGDSGPNNNAANTLPAAQGGRNPNNGVNNGMVTASAGNSPINNPDGSRLTPADPYSPTPSRDSNSGFYTTVPSSTSTDDTLVIGYSGDVKGLNNYDWVPPALQNPAADYDISFAGKVSLSDIKTGTGDDKIAFASDVANTKINVGAGQDEIVFGGRIQNTTVDLGGDGDQDTIRIASVSNIQGLRITGADDNDILVIGTSTYDYDSATNTWVDPTTGDRRTF